MSHGCVGCPDFPVLPLVLGWVETLLAVLWEEHRSRPGSQALAMPPRIVLVLVRCLYFSGGMFHP